MSPTFAQQHLRRDVVGRSHQRVSQAALVLPVGALLQRRQPVAAAAVGHVVPEVTGLHAVLSDVAPWRGVGGGGRRRTTIPLKTWMGNGRNYRRHFQNEDTNEGKRDLG